MKIGFPPGMIQNDYYEWMTMNERTKTNRKAIKLEMVVVVCVVKIEVVKI